MPNTDRPRPPFPPQQQDAPGLESEMQPPPQYRGSHYQASGKLQNKVALITGGDSGIGRSVADLFAREGADVAITYLPEEQSDAHTVQQEVQALSRRCLLLEGDLADPEFCQHAVHQTAREFGQLDLLINNAAMMPPGESTIETISDHTLERVYRVNIFSYYYTTRAALQYLSSGSAIINTGSIVGSRGGDNMIAYAATKGAIHALTKSLAKELTPKGIRVNCVAPGPVWTPLQAVFQGEDSVVTYGQHNPAGRPGQPDEMAPAYVFLASNADSSYLSGEIIFITGSDVAR